jgi:hypothetical protein
VERAVRRVVRGGGRGPKDWEMVDAMVWVLF